MGERERSDLLLAGCGGFAVEAGDGAVGVVETPLFPPDAAAPDFLVLRAGYRKPVVPVALVEWVDADRRLVHLHAQRNQVLELPEHLPVAS